MKRIALVLAGLALGLSAVVVHADSIDDRKAAMKAIGGATGLGAKIAKGEEPFDAAKVQGIFKTYIEAGKRFEGLFPANSKTGNTTASPKIWEDAAGFKAALVKFEADATAGAAASTDLASFRTAFGAVTKNCGSCHESFRIKR